MVGTRLARREFLRLAGGAAAAVTPASVWAENTTRSFRLKAHPATARVVGDEFPPTAVWSFNGQVPGPELRVRAGEPIRVVVENALEQETTVHWHGIRLPNAMDGVPGLTQPAIAPGESFVYEFTPPDAGTFWYHPHVRGSEQVDRGLAGALIVEEREPIAVDRDLTWVLDDWRLGNDASIRDDFGNRHDASHAGRLGNVATVNGRIMEGFDLRSGERLRLRLINVANARSFALRFEQHRPRIIAIDGQPVAPHEPEEGLVILGAAMRVDLLLDCSGAPGSRARVVDRFYRQQEFELTELRYGPAPPLPKRPDPDTVILPPNPLPEPDLERAQSLDIVLAGGAMGGMRGAELDGAWTDIRTLAGSGLVWAMNGVARRPDEYDSPILVAPRGTSHRLVLRNETAFPHPMHLHGHHFRVTTRDGRPTRHQPWQDTVLAMPRQTVEVVFKADNPGDWLFHCHVLEHMAAGMTGVVKVV